MKHKKLIYMVNSGDGTSPSSYVLDTVADELNDGVVSITYDGNNPEWTPGTRGKIAMELHDNGNGVTIQGIDSDIPDIKLDYVAVEQLYLLLKYQAEDSPINNFSTHVRKFKEVQHNYYSDNDTSC